MRVVIMAGRRIAAGQLRLFKLARIAENARREQPALRHGNRRFASLGKGRFGKAHHNIMVDLAGNHQRQPTGAIMRRPPLAQMFGRDPRQRYLAAQDRPAQRLPRKGCFLKVIENNIVGRITRFTQFLKHDILFARQIIIVKARVGHQIGDDRQPQRQVARQQPGMKHRRITRCPGVEIAADIFDLFGNRLCRPRLGALEHHMFEQMRQPIMLGHFKARAGFGMQCNRDGFHPRGHARRHPQAMACMSDDRGHHADGWARAAI